LLSLVVKTSSFTPELQKRGLYLEKRDEISGLTAREKIYGQGQSKLRDDHVGSKYRYDVYKEDALFQKKEVNEVAC
jgi:hypothetical protein